MAETGGFFDLEALSRAVGGRIAAGTGAVTFKKADVDSRKCGPGSLYVPIYGERVNGHAFIAGALESGAAAVLSDEEFWKENGAEIEKKYPGKGVVVVKDPLKALQEYAGLFRERYLEDTVRVGITGSSGKTTMKELLGAILGMYRPTSMNSGNLNSDIGLPMAVLSVNPEDTFSVLEMGMNYQGEMDILSDIYRPIVGLITNIGTAHVGMLGSVENIAREKKKIFRYLASSGAAFVWEGEPWFDFLIEGLTAPVYRYGRNSTPDFQEARDQGLGGWLLKIGGRMIKVPLMGEHNLRNALGAITAARHLGASLTDAAEGLEAMEPLFGRGEVVEGPVTIVADCYNANPDSFSAGIAGFSAIPWEGRKIVVAATMGELGVDSLQAHRALGRELVECRFDNCFFYGEECRPAFDTFKASFPERAAGTGDVPGFWSDDFDLLKEAVLAYIRPGDLLFIKGSRAMELERLIEPVRRKDA